MPEPIKAVATILVRETPDAEVLLVKRNESLRFMGGYQVFPGGRIESQDTGRMVVGAETEAETITLQAAVREVFEETGLLCARPRPTNPLENPFGVMPDRETAHKARQKLLAGEITFEQILRDLSMEISAIDFEPAGVWVTPPFVPVRFDTNYYLYRYTGDWEPEVDTEEIVELEWIRPVEARRRWHASEMKLPHPVAYVLHHLATSPLTHHSEGTGGLSHIMPVLRRTSVTKKGKFGRIELRCGIYILPLETRTLPPATHTNCVLVGEQEVFVIDPGAHESHEWDELRMQVDHLLEHGGTVKAVLLTHSHPDHVGAAPFAKEAWGCPIWAHRATADQLDFEVDRRLEDGELLESAGDPGWKLECIHTPGHDPGHLCFLEQNTGTLIAGDMIAQQGTIVISPGLDGDMDQYLNSLERLLDLDFRALIPSHGMPIPQPKEHIRGVIAHRLDREAKVKAALDSTGHTLKELLAAAYSDTPEDVWPVAEQSLLAHLHRIGYVADDQGAVHPKAM